MKRWLKSLYWSTSSLFPRPLARAVSYVDFHLASGASVYHDRAVHPRSGLQRGAVTISLDFELAWAWQYSKHEAHDCVPKGIREREQVPLILGEFQRYGIPATWATVGHLFLEMCSRGPGGLAHDMMPRPGPFETMNWKFDSGDWYQFDPCSDARRDPAWYAPDLIAMILSSPVRHEVACHSFSHVGFGPYCPALVAAAELDACKDAMAPFGLKPTTWIFPGSDEGNFTALAAKGVRIVRAFPKPGVKISLPVRRQDGMWAVHVSSAIDRGRGWTLGQRLARLKKFVDVATARKLSAHVWLHPSLPAPEMKEVLFPFLRYCAEQREKGLVDVLTMEQLVSATVAAQNKEGS